MDLLEELRQWSRDGTADFKNTFGVMPGRWLQLEAQYGTLGACQRILTPAPESWWAPVLGHLWEAGRLHWSAEAVALTPKFKALFTDTARSSSRTRLEQFNYKG